VANASNERAPKTRTPLEDCEVEKLEELGVGREDISIPDSRGELAKKQNAID